MLQRLESADSIRREVTSRITRKRKAEFGQFMTPLSVASFMASMFPPCKEMELASLRGGPFF